MKKYLVIGNPIDHSLSPKLHNFWIKNHDIDAVYEKRRLEQNSLKEIVSEVRDGDIQGINVTVPFKQLIIPFLDELTPEALETHSVNTVYLNNKKVIGHNTDIAGFELSIRHLKYDVSNKKVLILGAGGVAPSIIYSLIKMKASQITISNRTIEKAEKLKYFFKKIEVINWGQLSEFDLIINATSIGINNHDKIDLDFSNVGKNKFFYDVIYNPQETNFLRTARKNGHISENGKMMFIYQAHQAFTIWHQQMPEINDETIKLLYK